MSKHKTISRRPEPPRDVHELLPPGKHLKIRILVLHPGSNNDRLKCSLEVRVLKRQKNTYEAISYVWGDPNETVDIECNGSIVPITVNLAEALRHFRNHRRKRRLWTDALCINQGDVEEKGQQVSHMGQVYRNAKRVLVWLGPDNDGQARTCFDLMRRVNLFLDAEFIQYRRNYHSMPSPRSPLPMLKDNKCGPHLATLITHPWFFRVWTVQESALAKDCQMFWGSSSINIAEFVEFAWWCANSSQLHWFSNWCTETSRTYRNFYVVFEDIHRHYSSKGSWHHSRPAIQKAGQDSHRTSFALLLFGGHRLEATDARDHVYAFLGSRQARSEGGQLLIEADYSIDVHNVYYRIAHTLLRDPNEGPLLLSCASHTTREDLSDWKLSWIPYWNEDKKHMIVYSNNDFSAGGPIESFEAAAVGDGRISVTGFTFDTIVLVSSAIGTQSGVKRTILPGNIQSVEPTLDILWAGFSADANRIGIQLDFDAFLLTVFEGLNKAHQDDDAYVEYYKAFRKIHLTRSIGVGSASTDDLSDRELKFAHWVVDALELVWNMRLFVTEFGGIGFTRNGSLSPGDKCCIFLGATVPFILAPVSEGRHRLVTDCYIHGIMGGELVDKLDAYRIVLE